MKEITKGLYGHHKNTASLKTKKPNGDYCTNDLKNAELFKNFYSKLYNNHEGPKYNETILNEIDEQPGKSMSGIRPTDKETQQALSKIALVQMAFPQKPPKT